MNDPDLADFVAHLVNRTAEAWRKLCSGPEDLVRITLVLVSELNALEDLRPRPAPLGDCSGALAAMVLKTETMIDDIDLVLEGRADARAVLLEALIEIDKAIQRAARGLAALPDRFDH